MARRCATTLVQGATAEVRWAKAVAAAKQGRASVLSAPGLAEDTAVLDARDARPQIKDSHFTFQVLKALLAITAGVAVTAVAILALTAVLASSGLTGCAAIAWWAVVEPLFWLWDTGRARQMEGLISKPTSGYDPLLQFQRLMAHASFYQHVIQQPINWCSYLSKWFCNADPSVVRMGNLREMLAYGFFYATPAELLAQGQWHHVENMAQQLAGSARKTPPQQTMPAHAASGATVADKAASTCGQRMQQQQQQQQQHCGQAHKGDEHELALQEGYTPGLSYMAHLWQPLRYFHRPLLFYVVIEWLHMLTYLALKAMGMHRMRTQDATFYYTTGHGSDAANGDPIVFLHGVGLGILPYLLVVCRLVASGQPLLCPQFRHVSMRMCTSVPQADDVAARVVRAMKVLGWEKATIMAHSYGTFVASCMVQQHRQHVHSVALVDPVCFGMFLPDLLQNFVYRTPLACLQNGGLRAALRSLVLFLVSHDVAVACTFCRRFYWVDVNLWPEDLPPRSLVVLSGADELLHANEIRQVLSGAYKGVPQKGQHSCTHVEARVLYHPNACHASWLLQPDVQAEVVEQVLSMSQGESAAVHVSRRITHGIGKAQSHRPGMPLVDAAGSQAMQELSTGDWVCVRRHTCAVPCLPLPTEQDGWEDDVEMDVVVAALRNLLNAKHNARACGQVAGKVM